MKPLFEFQKMTSYRDCLLSIKYINKIKKMRIHLFLSLLIIDFLVYFLPYLFNSLTLYDAVFSFFLINIILTPILTLAYLPIAACIVSLQNKQRNSSSLKFYEFFFESSSEKILNYHYLKSCSYINHSLCFHFQDKKKVLAVCFINKDLIVKGDYDEFLQFIHQKLAESNATQIKL